MLNAFLYDGLRTPFGRHAGALAPVRPDDLVAEVIKALVARSPWKADQIEDVILGCTNQAGEDARNVARNAALAAGLPVSVPGQTVNRLCASTRACFSYTPARPIDLPFQPQASIIQPAASLKLPSGMG